MFGSLHRSSSSRRGREVQMFVSLRFLLARVPTPLTSEQPEWDLAVT